MLSSSNASVTKPFLWASSKYCGKCGIFCIVGSQTIMWPDDNTVVKININCEQTSTVSIIQRIRAAIQDVCVILTTFCVKPPNSITKEDGGKYVVEKECDLALKQVVKVDNRRASF